MAVLDHLLVGDDFIRRLDNRRAETVARLALTEEPQPDVAVMRDAGQRFGGERPRGVVRIAVGVADRNGRMKWVCRRHRARQAQLRRKHLPVAPGDVEKRARRIFDIGGKAVGAAASAMFSTAQPRPRCISRK